MSVAMVCREIYRIAKGGKPAPRWISKGLKDEIERELRAESMVFIVDDSKCEFLPELGKIRSCRELVEKADVEMVFDRLREFFSQDFGFVIFHVNERWAGQFANLLKKRVGKFVNIVEIRAPHLSSQAKEILARACWGFVKGEGETFDEMFGHCEKKFSEELEKARKDVELTHYVEWDKSASPEHESMKVGCRFPSKGTWGQGQARDCGDVREGEDQDGVRTGWGEESTFTCPLSRGS